MAHVTPDVARRIDRLSRRAHLFHRFAHHPLCRAYASEVIRIGRRGRVCRGCAMAVLGLLAGALVGAVAGALPRYALAVAAAGAALAARSVGTGSTRARASKVASRLFPAAGAGYAVCGALVGRSPAGLAAALATACAFGLLYRAYRRRGPDRRPCAECPERANSGACSGLVEIVRRERAFWRISRRLLRPAWASETGSATLGLPGRHGQPGSTQTEPSASARGRQAPP